MTAIITSVNYRMTLAIARDLAEHDIRVVATYSGEKPFTTVSRAVKRSVQLPDNQEEPEAYLDALYRVCQEECQENNEPPVLLPVSTRDLELLSPNEIQEQFGRVCFIAISSYERLDYANNKLRVAELCEKLGLAVPKTYHPKSNADFNRYAYPIIVKPVCGEKQGLRAGERFIVAETPQEAVEAWEHFTTLCGEVIVQQYLRGEIYDHIVVIDDGRIVCSLAEKSLWWRFPDGGHPTDTLVVDDTACMEISRKVAAEIGLTGLFLFQYICTPDGKLYLMEINCRVCGCHSVCRKAGSSMDYDWFAVSAGQATFGASAKAGTRNYFLPSEILYLYEGLRYGHSLKPVKHFLSLFAPGSKEGLFEVSDMRASLAYILHYAREVFRGHLGSSVGDKSVYAYHFPQKKRRHAVTFTITL